MPTKEDFEMALAIAVQAFREKDARVQAGRAGVPWHPAEGEGPGAGRSEVRFLGTAYQILSPEAAVRYADQEKEPALWEKILLLHYHNTSDGSSPAGEHITIKEIPDGRLYLPTYEKRCSAPLLGRFGRAPEEIGEPGRALGGKEEAMGDFAVTIPVLPRLPITLVFWKPDEEFEARVGILYDRTAVRYLPTEDLVLATQMMAFRLIGMAGKPKG